MVHVMSKAHYNNYSKNKKALFLQVLIAIDNPTVYNKTSVNKNVYHVKNKMVNVKFVEIINYHLIVILVWKAIIQYIQIMKHNKIQSIIVYNVLKDANHVKIIKNV